MQKPTLTEDRQLSAKFNKEKMCRLLNCTEENYCNLQYKYGIAYLAWYLPCNDRDRDALERSKAFWKWFKIQWDMIDEALINEYTFNMDTVNERRKSYLYLHCPRAMAVEMKPNSVVISSIKTVAV